MLSYRRGRAKIDFLRFGPKTWAGARPLEFGHVRLVSSLFLPSCPNIPLSTSKSPQVPLALLVPRPALRAADPASCFQLGHPGRTNSSRHNAHAGPKLLSSASASSLSSECLPTAPHHFPPLLSHFFPPANRASSRSSIRPPSHRRRVSAVNIKSRPP